jgi:hypothetical protein
MYDEGEMRRVSRKISGISKTSRADGKSVAGFKKGKRK